MAKKGFTEGYKTYDTAGGYGNAKQWQQSFRENISNEKADDINGKETPHSILGISVSATQAEIKKAFRAKIAEWHPDVNPHRLEEAETQSKKIIGAYTLLKSK